MTLVSSVDVIDGEPSSSLGWGHFFCRAAESADVAPLGGDIRLGSLGLGKGPEPT